MDKSVQQTQNPSNPVWLDRFNELKSIGVPVSRISKEIGVPRSTIYAVLNALKKREAA